MLLKPIQRVALCAAVLLISFSCFSQEQKQQEQKPQPAPQSNAVYRLEYVFSEVQNGKRINSRTYTALVHTGDRGSVRLSSRVPWSLGNEKFQYADVGLSLDCRVERETDGGVALLSIIDVSSIPADQSREASNLGPVIRVTRMQVENIVPLEKRTLIGSADQVDGTGRFDFEVTANKVR